LTRQLFGKDDEYKPNVILAPSVLSFSNNSIATIEFFDKLKESIFTKRIAKRKGEVRRQPFAIDLKSVRRISVPTAVVLAAELHRWSLSQKTNLRTRGVSGWSPRVRALLTGLGVFELLGVHIKQKKDDIAPEIVLLKLQSGVKRDGESVDKLQTWFKAMGVVFDEKRFVFGALDEAILNCIDHGYLDTGEKPRFPYAGHRWWATSCYDPVNDSLRFFVYDQGIGIPKSLPSNPNFWPSVLKSLKAFVGEAPQSSIIESAFEIGRSRTHLAERGKGLDKMREAIDKAGAGYLRVISGQGDVSLGPTGTLKKHDHDHHIGGTLVEWSIPVDALRPTGNGNG